MVAPNSEGKSSRSLSGLTESAAKSGKVTHDSPDFPSMDPLWTRNPAKSGLVSQFFRYDPSGLTGS